MMPDQPGAQGAPQQRRWQALVRPQLLAMAGALLLLVPATRLRIDRITCASWPGPGEAVLRWAAYLLAVALLTLAWLLVTRRAALVGLLGVLIGGTVVHLCAMLSPPFLSNDPLFYAAIGRAMAAFHHSGYEALDLSLPATDPFRAVLPAVWQHGTSSYGPGFHLLARWVGSVAQGDLGLALRLYQGAGLLTVLGAAGLLGLAGGARAAAILIYSPLTLIEATLGAHNDNLLLLLTAAAVLAVLRGRTCVALGLLCLSALAKWSGLLLAAFLGLTLLLSWLPPMRRGRIVLVAASLAAATGAGLYLLWPSLREHSWQIARFLGYHAEIEFCTRSVECIPRAVLRWGLGWPGAAMVVGLCFRLMAVLWLLLCARRAAVMRRGPGPGPSQRVDLVTGAAGFLFLYYLFFHAYFQPWYLLSLVPLVPWAAPRLQQAMAAYLVACAGYYVVGIPFDCDQRHGTIALRELAAILVVIGPPAFMLWRSRSPRRSALRD